MDRRQKKTREAIFKAFIELLSHKNINQITVGEIIERADVGRATFYAHFETKEMLLQALCRELFCHVLDTAQEAAQHKHIFSCQSQGNVFLHLFQHLQRNDNHITDLLSGSNNGLFLSYFKRELISLSQRQLNLFDNLRREKLPESFWVHHIATTFVETVSWWLENGRKESPEIITEYFLLAV